MMYEKITKLEQGGYAASYQDEILSVASAFATFEAALAWVGEQKARSARTAENILNAYQK